MGKLKNMTGQRVGRLTVLDRDCLGMRGGHARWICRCDCGNMVSVLGESLRIGETKSCGCFKKEVTSTRSRVDNAKHRETGTRMHKIWVAMKQRCYNEKDIHYNDYGKRGISVCEEWLDNYEAFRDWSLKNGYDSKLSIDRINVNGDYSPENCRWATSKEQQNNKRNNRRLTYNGETHTIAEWVRITGISRSSICYRLESGWPIEKVLTVEMRKR